MFGLTAPGPAGTVRTLLAETPAVWCRTMVYTRRSLGEDRGELRVLFEQTFGEPFGVADSTGTAAVSGNFLEAFLFNEYPPLWRRTRIPEGQPGEQLVHRAVDELTAKRDEPGPYLRAAIERGLVGPGARRRSSRPTVSTRPSPPSPPGSSGRSRITCARCGRSAT